MSAAWRELRSLVDKRCLTVGRSYTLSTGRRSEFYFDCKKAMLDGKCLGLIADAFLEEAGKLPRFPDAIGGLTMGADFIVAAVIQRAAESRKPMVSGSIVRKEKRNTEPETRSRTSFRKAHRSWSSTTSSQPVHRPRLPCDAFIAAGYDLVGIVALVDRESGGRETLAQKYGCPVRAIFRKRDFPRIDQAMNDAPEMEESAVSGG